MTEALTDRSGVACESAESTSRATFEQVYRAHFEFVWRSLARMGIRSARLDDATQDVFIVVHRRLHEFVDRHSIRSWLFAIALRVAKDYRRTSQRKDRATSLDESENLPGERSAVTPEREVGRAQARQLLIDFLESLDEPTRDVFVLMELEQMTAPEVSRELAIDSRAVYTRREAARRAFDRFVQAHQGASR